MSATQFATPAALEILVEKYATFLHKPKPRGPVPRSLRRAAVELVASGLDSSLVEKKLGFRWGQIRRWRAASAKTPTVARRTRMLEVVPDVASQPPPQTARVTIEGRRITIELSL